MRAEEIKGLMEAYSNVYESSLIEEEIVEIIAEALISQGYTSIDVLEYFANVEEETIIEDIVELFDGTLILESVVSEEYIEEQLQQLDEVIGAALRIGSAAMKAAKYAPQAAKVGQRALSALGGAGKAATRVAQQGTKASAVVRPALGKAVQAVKGAAQSVKGTAGGALGKAKSVLGGAVSKVKGAAQGALSKLPGGSQGGLARTAKMVGKAALGGAAFEGGMRAVGSLANKSAGAKQSSPSPASSTTSSAVKSKFNASKALGGQTAFKAGGGAAAMKKNPNLSAADIQKKGNESLFKAGGGQAAMKKGQTRSQVMAQGSKNTTPKPPAVKTPPSASSSSTSSSSVSPSSSPAAKPAPAATAKPSAPSAPAKPAPGTKAAGPESIKPKTPNPLMKDMPGATLKKSQETPKPQMSARAQALKAGGPAGSARERMLNQGVDIFDLVKGHLLDEGYAETEENALVMMANMSEEWRESIIMELTGGKGHPGYKAGSKDHGDLEDHPAAGKKGGVLSPRYGHHLGDMDDEDEDEDDLESTVKQQSRDSREAVRKPLRDKVKAARKKMSKEEVEYVEEDSRRMSNKQKTASVRQNIKAFGSNFTPPNNYDPDANRGRGEVLTRKQIEKKRRKELRKEENENGGIDIRHISALNRRMERVYEAQRARENPEDHDKEEKRKYEPVRGEKTPMPPRGDKRREEFEKWYAKQMGR